MKKQNTEEDVLEKNMLTIMTLGDKIDANLINKYLASKLKNPTEITTPRLNDTEFRLYLKDFLCSPIGGRWRSSFDFKTGERLNCNKSLTPDIKAVSFELQNVK